MHISTKVLLFVFSLLMLFACRDKEFEEHYGRPDWLAEPIYQQLQSKGNFTNFLACIDKAGYKQTLAGAGYFTVFAPNDAAFSAYLTAQGLNSVEDLDDETARKIVTYALVYNAFETNRLVDFQSNLGWVPLSAFKRRTAYYTGVYDAITPETGDIKVTASNRNGGYVFGDNNNKYIPYFINDYMTARGITSADYNFFFPGSSLSAFNVVDAKVLNADIIAENGVMHEIDKVILPLPSIDEYLDANDQYSEFRNLLEKYAVTYTTDPQVTERYKVLTGSNDPVYVKFFSGALAYSPNNENFMKVSDNDAQSDGWTMFAPDNESLTDYINTVLLEHYNSLDEMPPTIIYDFINAHMWQTSIWPSQFSSTFNFLGEEARFDPATDIDEAKMMSNGFFYGAHKVQDADVFRSVFGRAYLDPKYSLMSRFLQRELKSTIISPYVNFTLFLVSDDSLRAAGYDFNIPTGEWIYNGSTNLAVERWTRMVDQMVVITQSGELDDLSGDGIAETFGGEFIKYSNNTVFAAGNQDVGEVLNIEDTKQTYNGKVYYLDDIIRFPERAVGLYIRDLGDEPGEPYEKFYSYLSKSSLFNGSTGDILGVSAGSFHTFFIPSNDAIDQAIADKQLPNTPTPSTTEAKDSINNFILYHMLPKFSIINNGKEEGTFESLYKTLNGDATTLTISNKPGTEFTVTDMHGRVANVVPGPGTEVLSNRAIIHLIDNYLQY